MNPYYKLIFTTDTGLDVSVKVPNAKEFSDGLRGPMVGMAMSDILGGNAIKTKDDSNLVAKKQAFYGIISEQIFNIES